MTAMKIIQKAVDGLIPFANNARTHSDEQVAQIAASIKEFGFTNPVLLDGDNGVIAGHGRLLAARKLSIDKVPCIELSHLSETQKRAYILADNQLALNADWSLDALKIELSELGELDFHLDLIGFDDKFIDNLFNEHAAELQINDQIDAKQTSIIVAVMSRDKFDAMNAIDEALSEFGGWSMSVVEGE